MGAEDRYVHFSSTALGQGANMALPIWGIWMKKVLADGTLGISSNDAFPEGTTVSFCTGQEGENSAKSELEDYYFE